MALNVNEESASNGRGICVQILAEAGGRHVLLLMEKLAGSRGLSK